MRTRLTLLLGLSLAIGCRSDENVPISVGVTAQREEPPMRVTSRDGTEIAFDTMGKGPALIVVSGALSDRAALAGNPLGPRLGEHFTVYLYDRRGRGDSTDVQPYAVDREIEDIEALIDHAGGSAYVFGVSSGAALALHAAAALGPAKIKKLALYEPPYGQGADTYATQKRRVNALIELGSPGDAAEYFLTAIGVPPDDVERIKPSVAAMDFTLAYDFEVLGDGDIPEDTARAVIVPTLVLDGARSMPFMRPTADRLAELMRAQRKTLAGQTHQVNAAAVVPPLVAFFTASAPVSSR